MLCAVKVDRKPLINKKLHLMKIEKCEVKWPHSYKRSQMKHTKNCWFSKVMLSMCFVVGVSCFIIISIAVVKYVYLGWNSVHAFSVFINKIESVPLESNIIYSIFLGLIPLCMYYFSPNFDDVDCKAMSIRIVEKTMKTENETK